MLHLPIRQKLIIMGAVMTGMFLAALDQTIVGTALPKILTEFNALEQLSWVVTAYLLASTIAVPISGKLSDIFGRRRLLMIGVTIFVIASMLCGISQNIWQLIAYRALQGIGGGILFANSFAIIGDLFSMRERGKWQGLLGAVFGLSSLIGPLLGGFLTDAHTFAGITTNWRWTFYINVPIGLAAFLMIARFMPTITSKIKETIDFLGGILLSGGLSALILTATLGGTNGWAWGSGRIISLIVATITLFAGFVFAEKKADHPILPMFFFKERTFNLVAFMSLLFGAGMFASFIYVPLFAQEVLGFSATNSGVIILPMVAGLVVSSAIGGRLIAKTGHYKMILVAGLLIGAIGTALLGNIGPSSTYFDLAWRMVLVGLGVGAAMPIFTLIVQNSFSHKELGVASSSVQLFRSVGSTVGVAALGGLMNNILSHKLTDLNSDKFVQFAQAHGQGGNLNNLNANSLQRVLSEPAQNAILAQLSRLPTQISHSVIDAFHTFTTMLKSALAVSIADIFLASAALMAIAMLISLFIREVPLKHHTDTPPPIE